MNKIIKKIVALVTICAIALSVGMSGINNDTNNISAESTKEVSVLPVTIPKYVFLFIGDGMSYPQIQLTSDYLGAISQDKNSDVLSGNEYLPFMNFPIAGTAVTYDSTSFCPDSASAATSIATGHKTYSSTINMDKTKTKKYETIAEKLKKQLGYKIGIVTTVNLNHATPAAFYAHQASRNNFYQIGEEMMKSNFDYFAGGALKNPIGNDKNKPQDNLYKLAKDNGYKIVLTKTDAAKLTTDDGKAIVIGETLADSDSLSYSLDAKPNEWKLKDYVAKGIQVLDNTTGFFMMVEGGKIDWAGHANDAASTIADTIALSESIDEALEFYNKHPNETLILVTGDHETGGLTIGYAGTDYNTYLENLTKQKISNAKYDTAYVTKYKNDKTPFKTVLKDIKKNFGLLTKKDPDASHNSTLVLTDYEYNQLKAAYNKTLSPDNKKRNQEEYILYGTLEPLTVTITHLLNNKSGIHYSTYSHTGLPVGVFAKGVGAELFEGYYDNTEIYGNLAKLLNVK